MATRVDLSDFSFFPIAELDADGRRLAVAELPKVMLFDAQTGAKIDEYPWVQGDPDSDDVPVRLGVSHDDEDEDEDSAADLSERFGVPTVLRFSSDGRHFFVGCSHHSGAQGRNDCYLFDATRAGAPVAFVSINSAVLLHNARSVNVGYDDPECAEFTPDASEIAVGGAFGVLLFSVFDPARSRHLAIPPARCKMGLNFSTRDATALAFRGTRGVFVWCDALWLFDLRDLATVRRLESPGETQLGSVVRFRDDDTVVVASSRYAASECEQRALYVVDLVESRWTSIELPDPLQWLSPDATTALVSGNRGHDLRVVDVSTGVVHSIARARAAKKRSTLLTVSADGTVFARTDGGEALGEDCSHALVTRRVSAKGGG